MQRQLRRWTILIEMQVKLLLRNRTSLISSLGLAVISMLIFGSLLSGGSGTLPIAVVDRDGSLASAQVAAAFAHTSGIEVVTPCPTCDPLQLLKDGDVAAVVTLPTGFAQQVAAGHATAEVAY